MRRLWIAAAAALLATACREEGKTDVVLGAEKTLSTARPVDTERERLERDHAKDPAPRGWEESTNRIPPGQGGILGLNDGRKGDYDDQTQREERAKSTASASDPPRPAYRDDVGQRADARSTDAELAKNNARDDERVLAVLRTIEKGELEAAKLANQRAQSKEVKDYAQKILSESLSDLEAIDTVRKQASLEPTRFRDDPFVGAEEHAERQRMDALRGLKGASFDAAYMSGRVEAHVLERDLASYGKAHATDENVRHLFEKLASQAMDEEQTAIGATPKECVGENPQ